MEFECIAEGNPPPEVTWRRDGVSAGIDVNAKNHVLAQGTQSALFVVEEAKKGDTGE